MNLTFRFRYVHTVLKFVLVRTLSGRVCKCVYFSNVKPCGLYKEPVLKAYRTRAKVSLQKWNLGIMVSWPSPPRLSLRLVYRFWWRSNPIGSKWSVKSDPNHSFIQKNWHSDRCAVAESMAKSTGFMDLCNKLSRMITGSCSLKNNWNQFHRKGLDGLNSQMQMPNLTSPRTIPWPWKFAKRRSKGATNFYARGMKNRISRKNLVVLVILVCKAAPYWT